MYHVEYFIISICITEPCAGKNGSVPKLTQRHFFFSWLNNWLKDMVLVSLFIFTNSLCKMPRIKHRFTRIYMLYFLIWLSSQKAKKVDKKFFSFMKITSNICIAFVIVAFLAKKKRSYCHSCGDYTELRWNPITILMDQGKTNFPRR